MALLLLSTQKGLMNRFVETLVGKVPHYGVPIWVVPTIGHRIDATILSEINKIAPVFPYRDIYPEKIHLPGHSETPGRAVHSFDPLWKLPANTQPDPETCFPRALSESTLPLEVTLNKSWFKKHFDYPAYRKALESRLPPPCLNETNLQSLLWLELDLREPELVPFKIRWVEQIPAMENLAFLFPMTTYHIIWVSKDLIKLRYYPEMQGQDDVRVKEIFVPEEYLGQKELQGFIACTKATQRDDVIQFPKYLPVYWIQACANELPITQDWHKEVHNGDKIHHERPWALSLPCHRLNALYKRMLNQTCVEGNVPLNLLRDDFRVSRALVYARDYTYLSEIKDKLLALEENGKSVLYLHEIYKKSIDRFDFLAESLEALRWPYGAIFGIFLLLILWINIGTLIDHRRHRYGILLAKGMPSHQIYLMVFFQMFLVTLVGIVVALLVFLGIKFAINSWIFAEIVETHRDNLDIIGTLDLLPFDWLYLLVWSVGILVTMGIAALHLRLMPLRRDTAPWELLQ
ncbi:hypothetical protein PN36_04010 [Candidatus Thiomargarita nelsonii]|uniref:ABC3 transporter permease C-terminal domain-containing protein n=1 Tax=Candidatus Thiomargarita nelsonii TaxID=1003181 RepID=A0A0A6PND2_9GAMM|nr:hypothetical protein PN36_04010 [Candidatus Thiomargarita nelsonii]